jgi:hypothetical protein
MSIKIVIEFPAAEIGVKCWSLAPRVTNGLRSESHIRLRAGPGHRFFMPCLARRGSYAGRVGRR